MKLVLDKDKAALLLHSLDLYFGHRLKSKKNRRTRALRYKEYTNMIIARYGYVILIDKEGKYLCNNPKYLKQWAALKPRIKERPLVSPNCDRIKQ